MKKIIRNSLSTTLILYLFFLGSRASAIVALSHPVSAVTYTNAALGAILIVDADLKEVANVGRGSPDCFPLLQSIMGWVFLANESRTEFNFAELSKKESSLMQINDSSRNLYNDNLFELNRIFANVLLFAEEQENHSAETYMDGWNSHIEEIESLGIDFETIAKILKGKI
ncbi:MAG: hypothetical protein AB8G05_20780 [Oligoflexales bacterium]